MEIKAKIIRGVAVKLIMFHPNWEELELQFINQPEVIDERATKPKTKKSFIPWTLPLSDGKWLFVNRLVDPMKPKFHPIPININDT